MSSLSRRRFLHLLGATTATFALPPAASGTTRSPPKSPDCNTDNFTYRVSSLAPLPVELTVFAARSSGESIELYWETACERNNVAFRVQHARTDESAWRIIETVPGQGTTCSSAPYRVEFSFFEPGVHRFRLQQVDADGDTHESKVVSARLSMQRSLHLTPPSPHPVHAEATFRFGVRQAREVIIHLYNVTGEKVRTLYQANPSAGQMKTARIDGTSLASGTYFIRLSAGNQTRTRRMVVVH